MGKSQLVKSKTISTVRKINNVKLINKKQTKLLKRGKIKPQNIGRKFSTTRPTLKRNRMERETKENKIEVEEKGDAENLDNYQNDGLEDVIEMIDKDDLEYIKMQGKTRNPLSFTSHIFPRQSKQEQNDWNSVSNTSSEEEEEYEKKPRKSFEGETEVKHLLPIKDKYGIIPKMTVVTNKKVDEEVSICVMKDIAGESEVNGEQKQSEVKRQLSLVELYAERQKKLHERRQKIGLLASSVVENPEENLRNLKELVLLMGEKDPEIFLSSRKLAALSLLEIFRDILPSYKIRLPTQKEKEQRVKKDVKKLRDFEERLLRLYKHYLERLEVMLLPLTCKRKRKAQRNENNISCAKERAQHQLVLVSVKCFCDLLVTHPEFNFRENIIYLLIPLMANRNSAISEMCCETIQKVFRSDKLGETSLLILKQMSKMMKGRNYEVPPQVVQTFLSLNIRECDLKSQEETNEKNTSNKNQPILSRKERKRRKKMMHLEKELLEAEAEENKAKKGRFQTDILNQIFFLYFKILKNKAKSPILTPVLEGISKFAHLINIEFFDDLVSCFSELIEKGELDGNEMLLCIHTVFTVLSGQGVALNIDPQRFYSYLYRTLLLVNAGKTAAHMPILFKCLDVMLLKRKKQLTHHRVLAFLKRLCTVSLQTSHEGTLGILAVVRTMMQSHKQADILLDPESSGGSGVYLPTLEDPEHCNASATALWELKFLQRHYHPVVVEYTNHILHGCPIQGKGHLSPTLAAESPVSLLQQYETSLMKLNPQLSKSKKVHNVRKHHLLTSSESLISLYSNILEHSDDLTLKKVSTLKS
ncbi:nucleolar complex protein 3 homolog [Limulus polyphemus]|uniref:Nucleolar complex protein 3 homolog n=1 Tax=Limulus polyphemus TaxID=6850 RepID=A0ABM1B810_LIMPO|nr:nucleolar complex protein 3 homolog [Limulus polyphemus]